MTLVIKKIIGWREWIGIPELGIDYIKAKIDTGARTSSLHAYDLELFRRRGQDYARFTVHPMQRDASKSIQCVAKVLEFRNIRSSNGHISLRPVIAVDIELLGEKFPIELTLANRDEMGFRMLLGREAMKRRWIVDPGKSFYSGRPKSKKKKTKKKLKSNNKQSKIKK